MTLTVDDIERWDGGDVREVFHAATSRAQAAFDAADGLATLPAFTSWGGQAAEAATEAIGKTRKDLDAHGNEALAVAQAASRAADSIDQIKSDLAALKSHAEGSGLEIDPETNRIIPIPGSTHGRREMQSTIPGLQARLDSLVEQANSIDSALASAINMADGKQPIAPPASPNQPVPAETRRKQNERDAFKQATGRDPVSASDWETAAMLDPTSYDPKNKGVAPEIVAARIKPVPGKGTVRINAFIPNDRVWNFGHDLGDNRGFDPNSSPEESRVSMIVDYDNGIVVVRQNPSVSQESGNVAVAKPSISVAQAADGTVDLSYQASDGFIPGGPTAGSLALHNVAGEIAIKPTETGFALGGHVTDFPALEIYHQGSPLLQYMPSMGYNEAGPVVQLMTQHGVGDVGLIDQFQTHKIIPHGEVTVHVPSVTLGPVTSMPTAPIR